VPRSEGVKSFLATPDSGVAKKDLTPRLRPDRDRRGRAGDRVYLDLVKAQTGKKLTTAQATQLTTDATDLADAVGC
jgi:hypothetical protein